MSHPVYSKRWRDAVRTGATSSGEVLMPWVQRTTGCKTAVDVGCGEGIMTQQLRDLGVDVLGIDGAWAAADQPELLVVDFDRPEAYPDLGRRFDVAICLEVAEHVHERNALAFIGWLTSLAPTVIFSAAVPGQGGEGHVNERWPPYWVDLFARVGMPQASGAARSAFWDDQRIEWWYRQNLLIFGDLRGYAADGCPALVHPKMWEHHGLNRRRR